MKFTNALSLLTIGLMSVSLHGQDETSGNVATPPKNIKTLEGFQVELLYEVPADNQGSWVAMCVDPKGRLIVANQFGGLFRMPPPAPGQKVDPATIETVPAEIRAINGMLWAFDALYVGVNDYERKIDSGLYRITDSNGDDRLDKVEKLRAMKASGDHGVHAVLLSPDGKSLYLITGNNTDLTEAQVSRVPRNWGEDHLLPRMPDGRGHNRDRLAPGGVIYKVSPDGQDWEIVSTGFRNIYDAGFNRDGDLFTYDADMEYDFNTPWYRPTRVNHVVSGAMWGWRNGTGKMPEWYPDNLPPTLNIGPGSPTGVTFGYGAKYPAKYQSALYLLDWSWGKIYAVHLSPSGSSYTADKEVFLTGSPLPVTDAVIHPQDGAMYFAIGGRRVQSALYRVSYRGNESVAAARHVPYRSPLFALRKDLETLHGRVVEGAVDKAWPYLDHPDRFVRWAAYVAIQHQPTERWANRALSESDQGKRVAALLALAKVKGIDPFHRKPADPPIDTEMKHDILNSLIEVDWNRLETHETITLVRAYEIVLNRFGGVEEPLRSRILKQLDPQFPAGTFEQNWVLCETLAYLQSEELASEAVPLLVSTPTQEEQMEYARSLRMLKAGWTTALRTDYFNWFHKAVNYRGGASFTRFIQFIRDDAESSLTEAEKEQLKSVLEKDPVRKSPLEVMAEAMIGRSDVKEWTLNELSEAASTGLRDRNFEQGRKMFAAGGCFACHRFNNEGGMTGPDLTSSGGRFTPHDFLEQIIDPSKVINEQFVPIEVRTRDGEMVTGVVVNLNGNRVSLNTDMFDPNQQVNIDRRQVVSLEPSKISPMPEGLLSMMQKEEILDLVAYVLSGGDPNHRMFQ